MPDSISNLKLLRYLNLSETRIKRLPESVCSLYSLQFIILHKCTNLDLLPANMKSLFNLIHLDISGTQLGEMPPEMGKLIKLQKLTDFFLRKQRGSSIKELGKLKELKGEVCIWNLEEVEEVQDAAEADMKGKQRLKKLELRWNTDNADSSTVWDHARHVLEVLQPHTGVEYLSIVGYGGTTFPDWVGHSSFSHIVSLKLNTCQACSSLPPLGQLDSLQYLEIQHFNRVEVVGPELFGSCVSTKKPFGSLKVFKIEYMVRLREWVSCEGAAFAVLQELYVRQCPKLEKLCPGHLPCLSTLEIRGCQQFVILPPSMPAILNIGIVDSFRSVKLEKLSSGLYNLRVDKSEFEIERFVNLLWTALERIEVTNCTRINCLPLRLLPEVKTLEIRRCGNLYHFLTPEANGDFVSLNSLVIEECNNLESFPRGGLPASNLTCLSLMNCPRLKSLPENMHSRLPSLVHLLIMNCPLLETFPGRCLPKFESFHIYGCPKFIAYLMHCNLSNLASLSELTIGGFDCNGIESFPGKMLLPSALTSLDISGLRNLNFLDCNKLKSLESLKAVRISSLTRCSMPQEDLPFLITVVPENARYPAVQTPLDDSSLDDVFSDDDVL